MKFSRVCLSVALLISGSVALAQVGGQAEQTHALPSSSQAYVYWTNNANGTVGRANINGKGANESFIQSLTNGTVGGAGMTVNKQYIYWTSANGGTATTIARAKLNGSGVKSNFITGAQNPCGITANSSALSRGGQRA